MLRQPEEVRLDHDGQVILPVGLLAEAGLEPGSTLVAYSDGDGRVVLRRSADALAELLDTGDLR